MPNAASAAAARPIAQIDKDITSVHRELRRTAGKFNALYAAEWQAAWDRFPALHAHERALHCERGIAQLERDQRAWAAEMAAARRAVQPRPKKCPTCGRAA